MIIMPSFCCKCYIYSIRHKNGPEIPFSAEKFHKDPRLVQKSAMFHLALENLPATLEPKYFGFNGIPADVPSECNTNIVAAGRGGARARTIFFTPPPFFYPTNFFLPHPLFLAYCQDAWEFRAGTSGAQWPTLTLTYGPLNSGLALSVETQRVKMCRSFFLPHSTIHKKTLPARYVGRRC